MLARVCALAEGKPETTYKKAKKRRNIEDEE
jgi:hypothetical protein